MTRLLMLDFDEHLVSAVTRTLSQEGVEVVATSSVESARAEASQHHFDVALLDCDLIDPSELAVFAELPVILTTSFLEPEGQHRFFRRAQLLRKPFTSAQLLSALHASGASQSFQRASLMDVLRRAHGERQSLALGIGRARVFLQDGELIHAELDGQVGERALAEILADRSPADARPIAESAQLRSIHRPFQLLMLELLRHIEEREQHESELQETTHVFRKGSS